MLVLQVVRDFYIWRAGIDACLGELERTTTLRRELRGQIVEQDNPYLPNEC